MSCRDPLRLLGFAEVHVRISIFWLYSIAPHSKIPKDMKPTLIALLALFLSLPLVAADKDKPLPEDFKSLKALAEKGDAEAQSKLGVMYGTGQGVEQDFKEAFKWFQKASDQGVAGAQYSLGVWHEKGQGVEQDFREALKWYQKAADQGLAEAQYSLGAMYYKGYGADQDFKEAVKWFQKAAAQGYAGAQTNLGYVGVGEVVDEIVPVADFNVEIDGKALPILNAPLVASNMGEFKDDPEKSEYLVRVNWQKTQSRETAYHEKGLFAKQHTACRLRNKFTLEKLATFFNLKE
jgi:TPR repeat protein